MPQILVGGDNQDAYLICEAIEKVSRQRGASVVFCATPHEVLSGMGRGGVIAAVLNFEKAGLTNFELAYRIRESAEGRSMVLLLPEVDALGDVEGTLGTRVGVFAFPVDPAAIVVMAGKLLDAPKPPVPPGTAPAKQDGPASPEPLRPQLSRPDPGARPPGRRGGAQPEEPSSSRSRRVRHRTWQELRSPRREPVAAPDPEETDDEDPVPVIRRNPLRAMGAKRLVLGITFGVVLLSGLAYYGWRFLGPGQEDEVAASPGAKMPLLCAACGAREDRSVRNIHELSCRKCGGKLGFAFHCNDCTTDFSFVPPEKVKTLRELKAKPECPKCKSWNSSPMQPTLPPKTAKKGGTASTTAPKQGAAAAAEPAKQGNAAAAKAPPVKPKKSAKPAAEALDE